MSNKRSLLNDEIVTYLSTLSESESEGDPISEDEENEYIPNQESSSEYDDYHDNSGNENEQLQSTVALSNKEDTLDVQTTVTTILTGKDGTRWESIDQNPANAGRITAQNIIRETPGPTSVAKRQVFPGQVLSSFRLLIDDFIIKHIQKCTETEARMKLNDETWNISFQEIYATIGIMYARGVLAKGQSVENLWSVKWGPPFFRDNVKSTFQGNY
ncbi:uncharacterized protein [Palaemon carinicauda]|uniref:uncharacterized protein n=1 Tax=Palaemon carinicauda TaxID=392227 RepID=UPI0035B61277